MQLLYKHVTKAMEVAWEHLTFCLNMSDLHPPLLQLGCCLNYPLFLSAGKTYPKTGQAVVVHYTGKLHGSKGKEGGGREWRGWGGMLSTSMPQVKDLLSSFPIPLHSTPPPPTHTHTSQAHWPMGRSLTPLEIVGVHSDSKLGKEQSLEVKSHSPFV